MSSDTEIVKAYLAGEHWAFYTVQKWIMSVYYVNFGSKYADFMDDAAQMVHIDLLRVLPEWRGDTALCTFVKQTTKHRALDLITRAEGRYVELTRVVADHPRDGAHPVPDVVIPLPPAVEMVDRYGLTRREAAELLGISPNAVKLRVRRARRA